MLREQLAHPHQAQIGKIGLSIGIPVGEARELNKMFSTVKCQCYQPLIDHRENHGRAFELKRRFGENCLAGQERFRDARFLDRLAARGDAVILSTPAAEARAGSWFARELEYLTGRGYTLAEDGMRMLPPGP